MGKMNIEQSRSAYLPREVIGSKAFNLEYSPQINTKEGVREDIISYLGEYRFKISKFNYSLGSLKDEDGRLRVVDPFTQEPMVKKAYKAIEERRVFGDPTHREENELLGLMRLEASVATADNGDTIFWASPPGPASEGYGDYGFIYQGKVEDGRLSMSAIRLDNPTIAQYNKAMSQLTGEIIDYKKADDFLSAPKVVAGEVEEKVIERILKDNFLFKLSEEEQEKFNFIIRTLEPMIDRAAEAILYEGKNEKLTTFYALENYAISLRDKDEIIMKPAEAYSMIRIDTDYIVASMSYKPPVAKGSCGSTGSPISNQLFGTQSSVLGPDGLLTGRESKKILCCTCPFCGREVEAQISGGKIKCPECRASADWSETAGGE